MDIYRVSVKAAEGYESGIVLVPGQKVKITRMVTITYEAEVGDEVGESGITLEEFIQDELDNVGIDDIEAIWDKREIDDDIVVSVIID